MKNLAQAAKYWPNLTKLYLGNYFIDNLANNNIGVNGMEHFAEDAKYWPNLIKLGLCN